MTMFMWNVLLAVVWMLSVGELTTENFATGFLLAFLVLLFSHPARPASGYHVKVLQSIQFLAFFVWQLILSNLRVAHDVMTPTLHMRPAIIAVPLEARTDEEITFLANLISLTPGTLSLDVSTDRSTLYVHGMFVHDPEQFKREIKEGFERRLLELMR